MPRLPIAVLFALVLTAFVAILVGVVDGQFAEVNVTSALKQDSVWNYPWLWVPALFAMIGAGVAIGYALYLIFRPARNPATLCPPFVVSWIPRTPELLMSYFDYQANAGHELCGLLMVRASPIEWGYLTGKVVIASPVGVGKHSTLKREPVYRVEYRGHHAKPIVMQSLSHGLNRVYQSEELRWEPQKEVVPASAEQTIGRGGRSDDPPRSNATGPNPPGFDPV